jgi:hypothetical protein
VSFLKTKNPARLQTRCESQAQDKRRRTRCERLYKGNAADAQGSMRVLAGLKIDKKII